MAIKTGTKKPKCGLCGKTKNLTQTSCCGEWVCDDEDQYTLFSLAKNSCLRNHRTLTLCGYHDQENHPGSWQECPDCKNSFETELYVWYGTNKFNFEKLPNPPQFSPTLCHSCSKVIKLGADSYSISKGKYTCEQCAKV